MAMREIVLRCEIPEVYSVRLGVDSGEVVTHATLEGGFAARGVGRLIAERYREPDAAIFVIERICGICSHAHTTAFCEAVERALGVSIPSRASAVRTLVAELERMQSHSLNLAEVAALVEAAAAEPLAWAVRNEVTECLVRLTDNRIHYGMNRIGGITRDIDQPAVGETLARLEPLADRIGELDASFEHEVRPVLEDHGRWVPVDAQEAWGTGPNGRAAGIPVDVRVQEPYSAYVGHLQEPVVEQGGCAWARSKVRLRELRTSLDLVYRLLSDLPAGTIRIDELPAPKGDFMGEATVEAPRGANRHRVRLTREGLIKEYAVEVPTPRSLHGLERALVGENRSDVRRIVASFDPCMSCADTDGAQ